jgi:hypothetical protein
MTTTVYDVKSAPTETAAEPAITSPFLRRIPVLGYALRCFDEERAGELGLLLANVVMLAIVLVLLFGLPAFVGLLYTALVIVAGGVFLSTLS